MYLITLITGTIITVIGMCYDFALQLAEYGNIFVNRYLNFTTPAIITVIGCIILIVSVIIKYNNRSI